MIALDDARIRLAEAIFRSLIDLHGSEREAALSARCGSDVELRTFVEGLLQSDTDTGADRLGRIRFRPLAESPRQVGRYTIVSRIGQGGMGVVYEARQEQPVHRRVALKVIKAGMDTERIIRRFESERQMLAVMDHPGIARVLDGGTTPEGRPYLVMEYVAGQAITHFCRDQRLPLRARLELFIEVCDAVQHAHHKGVIHRDIKPSNVLVAQVDGRPRPRIIDFGIAKAIAAEPCDATQFTEHGQPLGTPAYMSPEQTGASYDIDMRSDIYGLGVLLYELLTGVTPFGAETLRRSGITEFQRMIREVEPPRPSTRVGESDSRWLRGDLDWIVMKCLEKDRTRRYETVNGLAVDIRRHLAGEAVAAAPPSAGYRAKKFVRRNKVAVMAASAVAAALLIGMIAFSWQAQVARDQRDLALKAQKAADEQRDRAAAGEHAAKQQAERAQTVLSLINEMLDLAKNRTLEGEDPSLRQHLAEFAASLDVRLKDQPDVEAEVRSSLGNAYRTLEMYEQAEDQYRRVLELRRSATAQSDSKVRDALLVLVRALQAQRRHEAAVDLVQDAISRGRSAAGGDDTNVAWSQWLLAQVLLGKVDYPAAEAAAREALDIRERVLGRKHADVSESLAQLGFIHRKKALHDQAESLLREAVGIDRQQLGELHSTTFAHEIALADALVAAARYSVAVEVFREALSHASGAADGDHLGVADRMYRLAFVLEWIPDAATERESLYRASLDMLLRMTPNDAARIELLRVRVALTCTLQGRGAEAETLLRQALATLRRQRIADDQLLAGTLDLLGVVLTDRGELSEAEESLRQAADLYRKFRGDENWTVGLVLRELALVRRLNGNQAEADELEEQARQIFRVSPLWGALFIANRVERIARRLVAIGAHESAVEALRWVIPMREAICPGHPSNLPAQELLESALVQLHAAQPSATSLPP